MKQNPYFSFPRVILNVSQDLYSGSFQTHEDYRLIDFWIQGEKTIKASLMHGAGFDDLAQYYIRGTFYYRIIVHWVTCSWVPCLLSEPAGDPRKRCLRKSISIILCPPPLSHHTLYCYLQSRHTTKCNVLTQ